MTGPSPETHTPSLEKTPSPTSGLDLRGQTYDDLTAFMQQIGEKRYRGEQIFRWVHARGATDFSEMTDVSAKLRARLSAENQLQVRSLFVDKVQLAADGTRKLRFRTTDGRLIESVLIPDDDARLLPTEQTNEPIGLSGCDLESEDDEDSDEETPWERKKMTQCISSQVGCAMDCDFCATAKLGFGRNLSAGEIVSQVYQAEALLRSLPSDDPTRLAGGDVVTNLVLMGMGEPLHNLEPVVAALRILLHPLGRSFSRRRITVSTAGLVPAIERFGAAGLGVNLAVSLNATTDAVRDQIMPINRKYPLSVLLSALRRFPLDKRQRITIEYVLLRGLNDSLDDARRLPKLLSGIPVKLNLIPWNPHPLSRYERPLSQTVAAFQAECMRLGFTTYVRKTRGDDIAAACGQLAAENDPRAGRTRLGIFVPAKG
ncbi:MAG TPA: 23S rRNA (adenine(2503)-C(2))-methyltransferase RlmN [Pseudomonadota bacterium]|jgi:23S rRNA (adenine2503-C2)-methyltransferase|nr:23S rRNA (adenine(2503)-C(2))-methyltransferase RlmN [Pseudomonadota bacterium]